MICEKGKKITRIVVIAFVLVSFVGIMSAGAAETLPGKGVTVQPARATWTTGFFLEAVYARALKDLGYNVKKSKELANPIFYQALVNGDVDFWANGWFPLHNSQLPQNFNEKAEIAGTVVKAGAIQGYLVDKTSVEKYHIKSLDDFKRSEVKKAFDANGDGKADLVACPPGWGCEKVVSHHLEVYGLENDINPIKASYSASMADALARYKAGDPIFFYTWTPNWTVNRLVPGKDVMWINVPYISPSKGQKGFEKQMTLKGVKGAVTDPIKMGFPANDIDVVANKAFLAKNPAVRKIFKIMSIPLSDIAAQNNLMFEGQNSEEDIQQQVTGWVNKNKKTWDGWQAEARAAAK